jgi:hypothetical protein
MKRSTIAKTFAIAAVAALAMATAPAARADDKGCSDATLKGTWVHTASGFETAAAPIPSPLVGPLVGVGTDAFDGKGGLTTSATLSINGNIVPVTATGTYTVNPDCTGTYNLPGTTLFFVIGDNGNEIQALCVDPGVVLHHTFRRMFPGRAD